MKFKEWIKRNIKLIIILTITLSVHLSLLLFYKFDLAAIEARKENSYCYMSDIQEYVSENAIRLVKQDNNAEKIIETENEVKEIDTDYSKGDTDYISPMMGADLPVFPDKKIRSRLVYPQEANEQGIEDFVVLELYINKNGNINKVIVVKDPGYGFAEAAVKAFQRIKCIPAKKDGIPFSVKIRKTIRFALR